MRTSLLLIAMLCIALPSLAQTPSPYQGWVSFDDGDDSLIYILPDDSSALWQIGPPNKATFNTPGTPPNVIVTDTANSYPTNAFSQFVFITRFGWFYAGLSFAYRVETDTLKDYGKVEVRFEGDTVWHNLLTNTNVIWNQTSNGETPVLSGSSGAYWKFAHANLSSLLPDDLVSDDTIFYRFTFVSDSVFDHKDGLMFDDISFFHWYSSVPEIKRNHVNSFVIPNPGLHGTPLYVQSEIQSGNIVVTNALGQTVYESGFTNPAIALNPPSAGVFGYTITDNRSGKISVGKFVVTNP